MSTSEAILVLIGGGHASGKKSGARILEEQLKLKFKDESLKIVMKDMEQYMSIDPKKTGSRSPYQFNFSDIKNDLEVLMNSDCDVIILYGLYALYDVEIVSMATVRVYIDCDADVRLGRWIKRDVLAAHSGKDRGTLELLKKAEKDKLEKLLDSYLTYSRSEMNTYIQDTKERADVILPKGADIAGFTLIIDGLQSLLIQKLEDSMHAATELQGQSARSYSTSSLNRETVIQNIKMLTPEPSVMSLTNNNFSNKNQIFYDAS